MYQQAMKLLELYHKCDYIRDHMVFKIELYTAKINNTGKIKLTDLMEITEIQEIDVMKSTTVKQK